MYSLCEDKSGGLMLESQQHITSNIPQLSMISDARKGDNPLLCPPSTKFIQNID